MVNRSTFITYLLLVVINIFIILCIIIPGHPQLSELFELTIIDFKKEISTIFVWFYLYNIDDIYFYEGLLKFIYVKLFNNLEPRTEVRGYFDLITI